MRGGTESFIKNSVCVDTQGEPNIEPSELVLTKQWQCTQTCTRRTTGVRVTMRTCLPHAPGAAFLKYIPFQGAASKRWSSAFLLILPIAFFGISATTRISVGSLYLVRVGLRFH